MVQGEIVHRFNFWILSTARCSLPHPAQTPFYKHIHLKWHFCSQSRFEWLNKLQPMLVDSIRLFIILKEPSWIWTEKANKVRTMCRPWCPVALQVSSRRSRSRRKIWLAAKLPDIPLPGALSPFCSRPAGSHFFPSRVLTLNMTQGAC